MPSVPELELDNQLCFALYAASRAMVRAYGPALGELGLTYPQYVAMLALWEADQPLSVSALSGRLHLDSGTVTPLLKRLQQLGLVERRRDDQDERRVLVTLTGAGSAMRTAAAQVPRRLRCDLDLDPDAVVALRDQLQGLVAALAVAERAAP